MARSKTQNRLDAWRIEGAEPKVDARALAFVEHPRPEERAALILASVYNATEGNLAAVPWACQVRAVDYLNANGFVSTLDEIIRLGGTEWLE